MSIGDAIARLPAPPPGVTARADDSLVHISLRHEFAPWFRRTALVGGIPAAVVSVVLLIRAITGEPTATSWHGPRLAVGASIALVVLSLAWMFGLFVVRYFTRGWVVWDGEKLRVAEGSRGISVRRSLVRGVHVAVRADDALGVDPAAPPWRFIRRRPRVAFDVRVPEGRLRMFPSFDDAQLTWVAQAVRALMEVPGDAPPLRMPAQPDDGTLVADARKEFGGDRRASLHLALWPFLLLALWAGWPFAQGARSADWPHVEGRVDHARYEHDDGTFDAAVRYTYAVDGRTYTNNRVGYWNAPSERAVRDVLLAHPTGSTVRVYYDPRAPGRSVLIRGVSVLACLLFGIALPFLAIAARLWWAWPTPAEETLLRTYHTSSLPWAFQRPNPIDERAADVVSWESSVELLERERQDERRQLGRLAMRVTAIAGVAFGASYYVFEPVVPPLGWWCMGVICGWVCIALALQPRAVSRCPLRPKTYRVGAGGIVAPPRHRSPYEWDALASFEVEPHPLDPRTRVALVTRRAGPVLELPLPPGDAGDRVVATLRERLPEVKDTATRYIVARASRWPWTLSGAALAVGLGWAGGTWFAAHPKPLSEWALAAVFAALVVGPGTLWAACVYARWRRVPAAIRVAAFGFNVLALLAAMLAVGYRVMQDLV